MSETNGVSSNPHLSELESIASGIRNLAEHYRGDGRSLLALLRLLESLHRDIRDTLFQETLPDNRQELYALLRDIEAEGGWPYIHRMRLQAFLNQLPEETDGNHHSKDYR